MFARNKLFYQTTFIFYTKIFLNSAIFPHHHGPLIVTLLISAFLWLLQNFLWQLRYRTLPGDCFCSIDITYLIYVYTKRYLLYKAIFLLNLKFFTRLYTSWTYKAQLVIKGTFKFFTIGNYKKDYQLIAFTKQK